MPPIGKRPKAVIVKRDVVETAGSFLGTLPEKPKETLSLREAMSNLKEPIRAALAKGYSYQDLAALLSGQGIEISASTLKNYVPSGKRQSSKESKSADSPKAKRGRKNEENGSVTLDATAEQSIMSVLEAAAIAPETKPARSASTRKTAAKPTTASAKTGSEESATSSEETAPAEKARARPGRKPTAKTAAKAQSTTTTKAKTPRATKGQSASTADEPGLKPKTPRGRRKL
jgi:hypothetical protein